METFVNLFKEADAFIWGPVMLVFLLGTGLFLTLGLRGITVSRVAYGFGMLWRGRGPEPGSEGQTSPFNALCTALAATIGTGNIAGVATAIVLGGPGAVFWMWLTAALGMATKYAETVLAVKYREVDAVGNYVGGPMYYIKNGLGDGWKWLSILFAFFGMVAAFGIGNTIQANSLAQTTQINFGVPPWLTATILAVLTFLVIIGGIRRLGAVAGNMVPFMVVAYVGGALVIIGTHIDQIPGALALIFGDAFTGTAAAGGFAGSTVMAAMHFGVARGVFSNEAGLGTAPIAHATAQTDHPVRQGTIGMLGTFIDTIVVCSMTALVIIMTGAWTGGQTGAALSTQAFGAGLPGYGRSVVIFGLLIFSYTTLLGWSYYGERLAAFIFGVRAIWPYRFLWIVMIFVGAMAQNHLDLLWLIADVLNGLMALPNLIAPAAAQPPSFSASPSIISRTKKVLAAANNHGIEAGPSAPFNNRVSGRSSICCNVSRRTKSPKSWTISSAMPSSRNLRPISNFGVASASFSGKKASRNAQTGTSARFAFRVTAWLPLRQDLIKDGADRIGTILAGTIENRIRQTPLAGTGGRQQSHHVVGGKQGSRGKRPLDRIGLGEPGNPRPVLGQRSLSFQFLRQFARPGHRAPGNGTRTHPSLPS